MIFDVARRTYSAQCRFIAGAPPGLIRWYWTKPGALLYPFPTCFGGSQFDRGTPIGEQGPGEVKGGLVAFVNGNLEPRGDGTAATGTQEQFSNGLSAPCNKRPIKPHPQPSRTQALDSINGV
jgi:hypothetical protein